jgi:hypothetical protein
MASPESLSAVRLPAGKACAFLAGPTVGGHHDAVMSSSADVAHIRIPMWAVRLGSSRPTGVPARVEFMVEPRLAHTVGGRVSRAGRGRVGCAS